MSASPRPSFLEAWLGDTREIVSEKGSWAIVPWSFLACAAGGASAAFFMPSVFFQDGLWDVSATFYAGLLAFNALTLALAWNAFGGVFERLSRTDFSAFLKSAGELEKYLFTISYIHAMQVIAAAATLLSGLVIFMPVPWVWVDRIFIGLTVCFTAYALRWAVGSVKVSQDLVWNFSTFDALDAESKRRLRLAVNNENAS